MVEFFFSLVKCKLKFESNWFIGHYKGGKNGLSKQAFSMEQKHFTQVLTVYTHSVRWKSETNVENIKYWLQWRYPFST